QTMALPDFMRLRKPKRRSRCGRIEMPPCPCPFLTHSPGAKQQHGIYQAAFTNFLGRLLRSNASIDRRDKIVLWCRREQHRLKFRGVTAYWFRANQPRPEPELQCGFIGAQREAGARVQVLLAGGWSGGVRGVLRAHRVFLTESVPSSERKHGLR